MGFGFHYYIIGVAIFALFFAVIAKLLINNLNSG